MNGIARTIAATTAPRLSGARQRYGALLAGLTAASCWAVLRGGGPEPIDIYACAAIVALSSAVYWTAAPFRARASLLDRHLLWPLLLLPGYALFQLVPLPEAVLRALSPERAVLLAWSKEVMPNLQAAPLTVAPAATFLELVRLSTCVLVFLLAREAAWRSARRPWMVVAPLLALGTLEGSLTLLQGSAVQEGAVGTYVNRNHCAAMLAMILPFAVMWPAGILFRARWGLTARAALGTCAGISAAGILMAGITRTLSRMGFVAALVALATCVAGVVLCLPARAGARFRKRHVALAISAAAAVAVGGLFLLPPRELVLRIGELFPTETISAGGRSRLWSETLRLIRAFPIAGCGLGGYEAAFMKYKTSGVMYTDEFAHNDYLQYAAETGAAGVAVLAVLVGGVLARAGRAAFRHPGPEGRALAVACLASIVAILVHCTVDFNLYIPAISVLLAWIAGAATGLVFPSVPQAQDQDLGPIVEIAPVP